VKIPCRYKVSCSFFLNVQFTGTVWDMFLWFRYFKASSEEEREHAEKLMKYQVQSKLLQDPPSLFRQALYLDCFGAAAISSVCSCPYEFST
jgi:hypothetical protein